MTGFNNDGIHLRKNGGIVPTPPTNKIVLYVDGSGLLQSKDETGTITAIGIDLTSEVAAISAAVDANIINIGTNTTDISNLSSDVTALSGAIDANTINIGTNTTDISNLTSDVATLSGAIDANASDIAAIQGDYVDLSSAQTISGAKTFFNDVVINSNLYVNGTEFIVNTTSVSATDNTITINAGEVGAGVTAGFAGIIVDRGTATNYQFVFNESSDTFRVGEIGSEQAVATREDSPTNGGVAVWDNSTNKFNTSTNYVDKSSNETIGGDKTFSGTTSFTDVGSSIVPDTSGVYDLGSAAFPFNDGYFSENSLRLGPNKLSTASGTLLFNDAGINASQLTTTAVVRSGSSITAGKGVSIDQTSNGEAVEGIDTIATRFTPTASFGRGYRYLAQYIEEDKIMVFDRNTTGDTTPQPTVYHYPGGNLTRVVMTDPWPDGVLTFGDTNAYYFSFNEEKTKIAVTYRRLNTNYRIFLRIGSWDNSLNTITWGSEVEIADTGDNGSSVGGLTMDYIPDTNYGVISFGKESGPDAYCSTVIFDFADGSLGTQKDTVCRFTHLEAGRGTKVSAITSSRIMVTGNSGGGQHTWFMLYSRVGKNLTLLDVIRDYDVGSSSPNQTPDNYASLTPFNNGAYVLYGFTTGQMNYIVISIIGTSMFLGTSKVFLTTNASSNMNFQPIKPFGDRNSLYFTCGTSINDGTEKGYIVRGVFDGNTGTAKLLDLIPLVVPVATVNRGTVLGIEVSTDKWITLWDSGTGASKYSDINLTSQTTYIGLAADDAASGETVKVITKGAYITSGLTDVTNQYLDVQGNVTETETAYPLGMSSNSTTLLIDYIPNPPVSDAVADLSIHEADLTIHWEVTELDGSLTNSIVPDTSGTLSLGSSGAAFKDLYLTDSLYFGSDEISTDGAGTILVNGSPLTVGGSGVTDHGDLTGLGDDDHTQYTLADGSRSFTGTVSGITPSASADLTTKDYVDTEIASNVVTDHGALGGLLDDDHTQYLLADGSREITGSLIPSTSGTLDLGSAAQPFRELYVTENSIYMGSYPLSVVGGKLKFDGDEVGIDLSAEVAANTAAISANTANIATNTSDIGQNTADIGQLGTDIGDNATDILSLQGDVSAIQGDYVDLSSAQTISGAKTFFNDVVINSNLYVNGTEFIVNTTSVSASDNTITINAGEVGAGVTAGTAGIIVDRGSETNYQFVFNESSDTFRVGEIGSEQAVATREDSPIDGGVAVWDNSTSKFNTSTNFVDKTSAETISGNKTFANVVVGVDPTLDSHLATKGYVDTEITNNVVTDHGNLSGLGDDDHTQYLLANGSRDISGSLVPSTSGTLDLGTSSKPFRDLYLTNSSLITGPTGELLIDNKVHAKSLQVYDLQYTAGGESVTPDLNEYGLFEYTLDGNVTLNAPSNMSIGQAAMIIITQDGTGSRVLTLNAAYIWEGGTEPTWTTTAGATDVISVVRSTVGYICAAMLDVK